MNIKTLILTIALLIASVVVSVIEVKPNNCFAQILLVMMGIIILINWISSYVKYCSQTEEQQEKVIAKLEHNHQITLSNVESKNEQLTKDNIKLKEQLSTYNHTKYVDIEGFYEWLKLKVLIDKDYIKKSFSDALSEYEDFKKKLK